MRSPLSRDILVVVEEGGHDKHETRCAVISMPEFSRLMLAAWRWRVFLGKDSSLPNIVLAVRVRGKPLLDFYADTDEQAQFVDEYVARYEAYRPSRWIINVVKRQRRREYLEAKAEAEEQPGI